MLVVVHKQRRLAVVDDAEQFGQLKTPVERDGDGADLARREQQLDDLRRGAVEVGDSIPGTKAG